MLSAVGTSVGSAVGVDSGVRVGHGLADALVVGGQRAVERRTALVGVGADLAVFAQRDAGSIEPFARGRQLVRAEQPGGAVVRDAAKVTLIGGAVGADAGRRLYAVDLGLRANEIAAAVTVGLTAIAGRRARREQHADGRRGDRGARKRCQRPPHR